MALRHLIPTSFTPPLNPLPFKTFARRKSTLPSPAFSSSQKNFSASVMASAVRKVLVPIANGTEPMEAVIMIDVLRRAGADVTVASVEKELLVDACHGVKIVADALISDCAENVFDLISLPGGMPGSTTLRDCGVLERMVKKQAADGRLYAAICAAPAVALGPWGLLKGLKATCHPSFVEQLSSSATVVESRVQQDGGVVTSRGPGTTMEFSVVLVEQLFGKEKADEVAGPLMDSKKNTYYTSLMYHGTNLDEQFLEASDQVSQHLNQPAHVSAQSSQPKTESTTKKSQRGGNFTVDEDLLIVSAFLTVSLDAMTGNEQKRQAYWNRVFLFFQKHNKNSKRNQNSLMHRWSVIQLSTEKFCSCLAQIEAKHQSGLNEQDKIVKAKEMYQDLNNNTPFQFEHCWNVLRYQPKWLQKCNQKKKPKKYKNKTPTSSSPSTPKSINLGEDDDSHDTFRDLQRLPGRKAEKERLNKRKGKGFEDDYTSSPLAGLLHEIKEDKKQLQAESMEMYERTYLQDQEKLAIEQERVRVERLKEEKSIMLMDTSAMPPMQAEYIRRLQMKIFEQAKT